MKHFFSEVEREVGKPASEMNRQEKMRALAYLDSRAFSKSPRPMSTCASFSAYPNLHFITIWTR